MFYKLENIDGKVFIVNPDNITIIRAEDDVVDGKYTVIRTVDGNYATTHSSPEYLVNLFNGKVKPEE